MTRRTLFLDDRLYEYMTALSVKPSSVQRTLAEVNATLERGEIATSAEQLQLLQLLVRLIGAKRCLEIGVFTGSSTLGIALALPADGSIVACDIDEAATNLAREFWERAGVASRIDLRLAPALQTLDALLLEGGAGSFDFAYIDADKGNSDAYYERVLTLLRANGLMAIDNVFWGGLVADPRACDLHTRCIKALNAKMCNDHRVEVTMVPLGDGLMLARKRSEGPVS